MGATALALLRAYRRTALLLALGAAVALWAGLPVALLAGRLSVLDPAGLGDGLHWSAPVTPVGQLRQAALDGLGSALIAAAGATVGVALLALIALAAARMAQREGEVAVRRAVGASRRMLLGGFALEGGAIALLAVVLGLPVGFAITGGWGAAWPGHLEGGTPVAAMALVVLLVLVLVLGALFPLLFARRLEVTEPADAGIALRIPALLLGGSLTVLTTGLLISRHLQALAAREDAAEEPGLVLRVGAGNATPAARAVAFEAVLARAAAVPGVVGPSLAHRGALMGLGPVSIVRTDCGPCWPFRFKVERTTHFFVTTDSFRALGARLSEGRLFTDADRFGTEPVAVINERLAREQFAPPAVGRHLMVGVDPDRWYRVIGVVADGPAPGLGARLRPAYSVYLHALQHPPAAMDLVVPGAGVRREAVAAAVATVPGMGLEPAETSLRRLLAEEQAPMRWFGPRLVFEGWTMLLLAVVGTFALVRLWVHSLALEIGVQRAVGAARMRVLRSILARALLAGIGGVAIGGVFGPLFQDGLRLWLPGLGGWDAAGLLPAAGLLLAAALAGALQPAITILRTPPAGLFGTHGD